MRTIRSVLRTVANYLMWRDIITRVMSVISLSGGGWLTGEIWLVQSLLHDRHPYIMLVLTSLFVRHWCLLLCAPACGIHCPDGLLVLTGVFIKMIYSMNKAIEKYLVVILLTCCLSYINESLVLYITKAHHSTVNAL